MWYDDNYFDLITPKVIDLILCQLPSSSVHKFSLDSSDSNSMFLYFLSFPGVIFVRPCQFLKFHYFLMKLQLYIPLLSTSWEVASLPGIAPAKQALLESGLSPLFLNIQLATWLRLVRLLLDENFEYFDIFNISMTFLHDESVGRGVHAILNIIWWLQIEIKFSVSKIEIFWYFWPPVGVALAEFIILIKSVYLCGTVLASSSPGQISFSSSPPPRYNN